MAYGVDADALRPSLDSAFWVFNLVAHMAYTDRHHEVPRPLCPAPPICQSVMCSWPERDAGVAAHPVEDTRCAGTPERTARMEAHAVSMLEPRADAPRADAQRAAAIEAITEFGVTMAQELVAEWRDFWLYLSHASAMA